MTKKLFCLVMTIAMVFSLFVISADASVATSKIFVDESFTLPEGEDGTTWRPEGWTVGPRHGLAETAHLGTYVITEEGYAEVCKGDYANGGACVAYKFPTLPDEYTLMFDVRYPDAGETFTGTVYVDCSLNGFKQNVQPSGAIAYLGEDGSSKNIGAGAHSANVWYTYVFQISGDRMSIYRKSENEDEFSLKGSNLIMPLRDGGEFYAYSTSPTARIHIDNVKVFSGTYMTNAKTEYVSVPVKDKKFQKADKEGEPDVEVALDAEEQEGKEYYYTYRNEYKIKGEIEVESAKVAPTELESVIPVMTIYDQKGKVIDMFFNTGELKYNTGNIYTLETPQYTPEKLDEMKGYTIELYLWDSFAGLAPQTAAYVINVQ